MQGRPYCAWVCQSCSPWGCACTLGALPVTSGPLSRHATCYISGQHLHKCRKSHKSHKSHRAPLRAVLYAHSTSHSSSSHQITPFCILHERRRRRYKERGEMAPSFAIKACHLYTYTGASKGGDTTAYFFPFLRFLPSILPSHELRPRDTTQLGQNHISGKGCSSPTHLTWNCWSAQSRRRSLPIPLGRYQCCRNRSFRHS